MSPHADSTRPGQQVYARWLAWCARVSLALLVLSFFAWLSGYTGSAIPVAEISRYWAMSASQYTTAVGGSNGAWFWRGLTQRPDLVSILGVATIALVTPACLARLLLEFVRRKDRAYAAIVAAQLLVLAIAASGIMALA